MPPQRGISDVLPGGNPRADPGHAGPVSQLIWGFLGVILNELEVVAGEGGVGIPV